VPRYFFTIRGRDRVKDDPHGTSLPDVAAALSNAERKIRELRKEGGYNNDPTLMMITQKGLCAQGWSWSLRWMA
jgi:hypothetical protein